MFQKIGMFMIVVSLAGLAFADTIPQVATSEVFTNSGERTIEYTDTYAEQEPVQVYQEYYDSSVAQDVPVWPLAGSEADVEIACSEDGGCGDGYATVSGIRFMSGQSEQQGVPVSNVSTRFKGGTEDIIVTKVGSGLVIENNINTTGTGWSGGPNISNGIMVPAGFDYECANNAEMPLMRREMMEDDGGSVLAMSRSSRKMCGESADSYAMFAQRAGFKPESISAKASSGEVSGGATGAKIAVNEYIDEENDGSIQDQVRSWVVVDGQTLREVLQSWCDKSGWDLVWTTAREYPIEASAVFKGRFMDVASALVRNFERATPIPYAKFYKGNRVVVVSTSEE